MKNLPKTSLSVLTRVNSSSFRAVSAPSKIFPSLLTTLHWPLLPVNNFSATPDKQLSFIKQQIQLTRIRHIRQFKHSSHLLTRKLAYKQCLISDATRVAFKCDQYIIGEICFHSLSMKSKTLFLWSYFINYWHIPSWLLPRNGRAAIFLISWNSWWSFKEFTLCKQEPVWAFFSLKQPKTLMALMQNCLLKLKPYFLETACLTNTMRYFLLL